MFKEKKGEKPGERSRTANLRQSATYLLRSPKVRKEAERLARGPHASSERPLSGQTGSTAVSP